MGRPRTFDREEVLDRAVELFWARGYERTSVQDLVDSMGIQRGSLYAAFGDKRQLFLAALDRYEERFYRDMQELITGRPASEAIRLVFERVIEDCACGDAEKGCFVTNTAVALAEDDDATATRIRANLARLEDLFFDVISPTSRPEGDARARARFLTNSLQGLRVLSKCRVAPEVLRDVIAVTLAAVSRQFPSISALERELPNSSSRKENLNG
jgi:TetR/AcrR family transcriptional repressor of nem operon